MAIYYWVGGSGTWDNTSTANWSLSSGGSGGAGVPTSSDTVNFSVLSGTGTCSVASTATCLNLSQASANITIRFTAGVSFPGTVSHLGATIDLNSFTVTCLTYTSSGTGSRTLAFGASGVLQLSGNSATVLSATDHTGLTLSGSRTVLLTYSGSVGVRTILCGNYTTTLTAANAFVLQINGGTDTININAQAFDSLDFAVGTGFTGTLSSTGLRSLAGGITFTSGMNISSITGSIGFYGTGSAIFTTNGLSVPIPLFINKAGGTVTLSGTYTSTSYISLDQGTLLCVSNTLNATYITSSSVGTRALTITSSTINLSNASGAATVFSLGPNNVTLSASFSTIVVSSATATIFDGNGLTYGTLTQAGAGALTISGSNTFETISNSGSPRTIKFTSGTTQTLTGTGLSITGTAGNLITLSGTSTSTWTLFKPSGSVSVSYASISNSTVTGGATWNAPNSTNGGGNVGWVFRTLYWVGGTATWDSTAGTKWSTTSGGAGGESAPTDGDNVIFNGSSGSVTVTIGAGSTAICRSLTATGFIGTLNAASQTLTTYGNITFGTGMTITGTTSSRLYCASTAAGQNRALDFNGKAWPGELSLGVFGYAHTVTLTTALTVDMLSILGDVTLTTNSNNILCTNTISVGNSTPSSTLNLGSSTLSCNSWFAGSTAPTLSGAYTIVVSQVFLGGGYTYNNVIFSLNSAGGAASLTGSNTFANLTLQNSASSTNNAIVLGTASPQVTQTITGTLTITGNNASNRRILIKANDSAGTTRSILNPTGARSITNADFMSISVSGTALSGTSIGNAGNNANITATTAVTRYARSPGNFSDAIWSSISGGGTGASVPLPQDTIEFDSNTQAGIYTNDLQCIGQLNCSPTASRTLSFAASTTQANYYFTRGATINSNVTLNAPSILNWAPASNSTLSLTPASGSFTNLYFFGNSSGTLGADLSVSTLLYLYHGTFDASTFNVSANSVAFAAGTLNMGSGTWTLTGTGTVWNASGATINAQTSNILLSNTTTSSRTFAGSGLSYNKLTIGGATGTSTLTITGSNTFAELASTKTVAHTVLFTNGTTTNIGRWSISGSAGNLVTVGSTSTAPVTLTYTGTGKVSSNYLSVSYVTANPDLTWYVGANSTNGGNNTRVYFLPAPGGNGLFFGSNF